MLHIASIFDTRKMIIKAFSSVFYLLLDESFHNILKFCSINNVCVCVYLNHLYASIYTIEHIISSIDRFLSSILFSYLFEELITEIKIVLSFIRCTLKQELTWGSYAIHNHQFWPFIFIREFHLQKIFS